MSPDQRRPDRAALLGRDYWLVLSTPAPSTSAADIEQHLDEHLAWMLGLEADGTLFLSGPLTGADPDGGSDTASGISTRPGAGITVLRAASAEQARAIAAADPFVLAGLRTFEVFGWRVNEGSIRLRLSLGIGTYDWD